MSGSFTVGALAIARPEANAVGAVRMTLLPKRLEVELLLVGSYGESFVPGALTRSVRMSAPYTAVRGLVRKDAGVVLTFDPRVVTPYNRFVLTHFTDLPLEALASAHKRRARAALLATVLPLPLAGLAALLVPADLASGVLGRGALGLMVFVATATLLRLVVRLEAWGGPLSDRLRDAFEHRLAQRLAIEPAASFETDPFDPPEAVQLGTDASRLAPVFIESPSAAAPGPAVTARFPAVAPAPATPEAPIDAAAVGAPVAVPDRADLPVAPRRRFSPGVVRGLAFTTLGVLTAVGGLAVYGYIERRSPPAPLETARSSVDAASTEAPSAAPPPPVSKWPSCSCARADSPLWKAGLPALTLIPISKQRDEAGRPASSIAPIITKGVPRYDFDMAIVNDAAVPLKDVRVVLTFARRNKRGERTNVTDRGLFWEGELGPGRSVKWNVEAPGSEVRIDVDERRKLGEVPPAPADAFVKLLGARQPSVRLHAAMMLAYLGDPRGRDAAQALGDLGESDELVRKMILRATEPLRVCDVKPSGTGLEACLVNADDHDREDLELVEIGPEGSGRRAAVDEPLLARSGKRVVFPGFGEPPEELALSPRR